MSEKAILDAVEEVKTIHVQMQEKQAEYNEQLKLGSDKTESVQKALDDMKVDFDKKLSVVEKSLARKNQGVKADEMTVKSLNHLNSVLKSHNKKEIDEAQFKDASGAFAKLKINYSDSKYVSRLQKILDEREASKRRLEELKAIWGEAALLKNGTFILFDTHLVLDTKTALEWIAGPDKATGWYEAKSWVTNLTVAGGGWRMPTRKELKTLYKKGAGQRNMTPLLKTTGWWVWSLETKDSLSAWGFSFSSGLEYWYPQGPSFISRGFAVRSRK